MLTNGWRRVALVATVAVVLMGCAEERAPISRVQADALDKAFFVGDDLASTADDPEFYTRTTVVDVGYGTSDGGLFTASAAGQVARIKWEITQDMLLGRLTHELIDGADGHGAPLANSGQVVAAFAIKSQFDIKRSYNPSTGEESNVIEENGSDRPWYERRFFRVDWSQNLVTKAYTFDLLSNLGMGGAVDFQNMHYYVSDPASEDAPLFAAEDGYFDVTSRVYASPKILNTPYGTYPACYFNPESTGGTFPLGSCNPTEVTIRLSFRKVVDTDYEPKDWNGNRFAMFGAFYDERRGYDPQYGVVDAKWRRYASFYNLWQRSHIDVACNTAETTPLGQSPHRDEDADGTEDECAGTPGSRCDEFTHKCTIPYATRTTRTIAWYSGLASDPELFDTTAAATGEWDMALRKAVQVGRLVECRRTHGASIGAADATGCDGTYPMDDAAVTAAVPAILLACHNPVAAGDPEGCGPVGRKARLGDIRYNLVNAVPTPQMSSPWGIMADGVDPLTGEKVAASINVWDSVTQTASQSAVDIVRWLNGEISEDEIKSGAYINKYAISGDLQPKNFYDFRTMSNADITTRLAALSKTALPSGSLPSSANIPAMQAADVQKLGAAAYEKNFGPPVDASPAIAARYAAARDSKLEAELLTAPFMELAGLNPATPVDAQAINDASPIRGGNLPELQDLARARDQALAEHGMCMVEAPEPTAFVGLSKLMLEKFPVDPAATPADLYNRVVKMRAYLRKRLYFGVVLHEMGHSVGLRHNFVGSYDAFNFRPQYWQLRTNNGMVTKACTDQVADGKSCVGPRWLDPIDDDETNGLIWMWQHTTVMDYPGDVSQDTLGLGPYDKAAARFFYGDALDVWNTPGQECKDLDKDGACDDTTALAIQRKVNDFGGIGGPWTFKGPLLSDAIHYSQFQKEFNLIRNCKPADTSPPADWNAEKNGVYSPVFDGQIVLGTTCEGPPVDWIDYRDLESSVHEVGTGRIRWPHMFATDYSADIGNVAVLRHDNGADMYEQFSFLINTYENRHIFDNFRRGRQAFSVRGAANRAMSRYHDKIRNLVQGFALYHDYFLRGLSLESGQDYVGAFENVDGVLKANAIASSMAFDLFTRILSRPQPGAHTTRTNFAGDKIEISDESQLLSLPNSLDVPEGSKRSSTGDFGFGGRKLNNSLSNADGAYDIQWLTSAGSYYDKAYATYHLTESSNRFLDVSLNDFVDGRYRNLSFVNIYPEGFRRLVGAALTSDDALLGARVSSITGTSAEVDVKKSPKKPLGWVSWWPSAGPEVCWPIPGSMLCHDPTEQVMFDQATPKASVPIDPEIGWEIQKFIVFYSLLHLPENGKSNWVDQFRIYAIGSDSEPGLPTENAIYFRDPESGMLYIARRRGTEVLFGKTVEKGISARMLAWANTLTQAAYVVDHVDSDTGMVTVAMQDGEPVLKQGKTCDDSPACMELRNYKALLDYTRATAEAFGFPAPHPKGIDFH